MDAKLQYDMTDATTSVLASQVLTMVILEDDGSLPAFVDDIFDAIFGTDDQLPPEIKQRMGIPAGMPALLVPAPVFGNNKKTLMRSMIECTKDSPKTMFTIESVTEIMYEDPAQRAAKRKEMLEVIASKLFELCMSRHLDKKWAQIKARAGETNHYGLMIMG